MAVAYILNTVSKGKVFVKAFYTVFLLAYCFMFADYTLGNMKLGTLIPPILISLLIFVCEATKQDDYQSMIDFFKTGFIVSAIIGFFKEQIPSIARLFEVDFVNDAAAVDSNAVQRYSGLTYDPNFFTVVNCILITILLFNTEHFTIKKGLQLLFLLVTGFMTFSKSYMIIVGIILLLYIVKRSQYVGRNAAIFIGAIVAIVMVGQLTDLDLLEIITSRFESSSDSGDLTTGRLELWKVYVVYILNETRVWFLGAGLNADILSTNAVHNTYIDFVYRFGIIGSMVWLFYFVLCYMTVRKKSLDRSKNATIVPLIVCMLGFMFLSAFHFQQLWCCICLAYFALNIPKEDKKCLN